MHDQNNMTPRSRRLLAWLFVAIFVVGAGFVIAQASGWQWSGWRQGFVRSGIVVMTSSPKATIYLNGKAQGVTPKRLGHLAPGLLQLELRAQGYQNWSHVVRIQAGQAIVIGPVTLLPATPAVTRLDPENSYLLDHDGQRLWSMTPRADQLAFTQIWPGRSTFTLPSATIPSAIAVSPHQHVAVAWNTSTTIYSLTDTRQSWAVPSLDTVWWLPSSEAVVYGLHDGQVYQFDTVTQTATPLGAATQAGPLKNDVWRLVQDTTGVWTVVRQSTFGTSPSVTVATCISRCYVASGPNDSLIIREENGATTLLTWTIVNQLQPRSIGTTTAVFWRNANDPPLWLNGTEMWTWDDEQQPVLLDRHAAPVTQLAWLVPGHILVVADAESLTISSVSARQGRGTLWQEALPADTTVSAIAADGRSAVLQGSSLTQVWSWSGR